MKDLHLLVPCTAKKTSAVPHSMNLNHPEAAALEDTLNQWVSAFYSCDKKVTAQTLYTGQAFKSLSALSEELDAHLHILSAGFGLVSGDTLLPGYNATFSANTHRVPSPFTQWWQALADSHLPGGSITELLNRHPNGRFVFCISNEYLNAIEQDLKVALDTMKSPKDRVVLISSKIPKSLKSYDFLFIQCAPKTLHHKDTTKTSKNNGLAISNRNITTFATHLFLHRLKDTNAPFSDIISALNEEFEKIPVPKKVIREKRDDAFIIGFIQKDIEKHGVSAIAKSLERYKAAGFACLDTRFSGLYKETKNKGSM